MAKELLHPVSAQPSKGGETWVTQASLLEQEAKLVLPGILVLFGFQLLAILNQNFDVTLSYHERILHWFALALTLVSAILVITPFAYRQQAEAAGLSRRFSERGRAWINRARAPLAVSLLLDFFLLGSAVTRDRAISLTLTLLVIVAALVFQFAFRRAIRSV